MKPSELITEPNKVLEDYHFNPILHESEEGIYTRRKKRKEFTVCSKCGDSGDIFYRCKDKRYGLEYDLQPCKKCYKEKNARRWNKSKKNN